MTVIAQRKVRKAASTRIRNSKPVSPEDVRNAKELLQIIIVVIEQFKKFPRPFIWGIIVDDFMYRRGIKRAAEIKKELKALTTFKINLEKSIAGMERYMKKANIAAVDTINIQNIVGVAFEHGLESLLDKKVIECAIKNEEIPYRENFNVQNIPEIRGLGR